MTVLDCLSKGIADPLTIAQQTGTKLPQVTAELLNLYHLIGGSFAKQMLRMQPLRMPLAKAEAAMTRLHEEMTDRDSRVLELGIQGILNYKTVAERLEIGPVSVRSSRSHMIGLARLKSFEEVVRLCIFYRQLKEEKKKKAARKK